MSSLHSLPFPPLTLNLTPKPSSLKPLNLPHLSSTLPQKILTLELLGIDSPRLISLHPTLLSTPPTSLNSTISFLLSKGLLHKDLSRILSMCPKIITLNIAKDLTPIFNFLSLDLHLPRSSLRLAIKKCPRFLTCSVKDQLKPALTYLRGLGFRDFAALAVKDPVVLVSSVEKTLMAKVGYLEGLGLGKEEAAGMVVRCPSLLSFSVEKNYKPKYEYLVREMGGGVEEVKEFPQYFGFSLERRIKARHRGMEERGVRLPLALMLKSTDEEFEELVRRRT